MTDRHSGYVVTLENDMREDDAELVLQALRMIRGVLSVEPVIARSVESHVAEERVDAAWRHRIRGLLADGR